MIFEHYTQLFLFYRRFITWFVLGFIGAVVGISVVLLYVWPEYEATATVQLVPTEAELAYLGTFSKIGIKEGANPAENLPAINIEYLLSKPVAERVFDKVRAQLKARPQQEGWQSTVSQAIAEAIKMFWVTYNTLNSGKYVEPSPREIAINQLISGTDIETAKASYILKITVTLPRNAEASALAANALAEAYIERVSEQSAETAAAVVSFLDGEINARVEQRRKLQEQEFELRQDAGILALEQERQGLLIARDKEQERLVEIRIEREELQARLQVFEEDRAALQQSGTLAKVEQEMALSDANFKALDQREKIREQSIERINADLAALNKQENPLIDIQDDIDRLDAEINDLRRLQIAENLSNTDNLRRLRVVDPAIVPEYASFPQIVVNTAVAILASAAIVLFFVIAADTLSGTVKTTVELRRLVGNSGLGSIPRRVTRQLAKNKTPRGNAKLEKTLRVVGKELETRMAAQGLFDSPLILLTGFGSIEFVNLASLGVAAALAAQGARVSWHSSSDGAHSGANLLEGLGVIEAAATVGGAEIADDTKAGEPAVLVECIGPFSANFSWQTVADKSGAIICAIPDGQLSEDELAEFRDGAVKRGVPDITFLMIAS